MDLSIITFEGIKADSGIKRKKHEMRPTDSRASTSRWEKAEPVSIETISLRYSTHLLERIPGAACSWVPCLSKIGIGSLQPYRQYSEIDSSNLYQE